ncbi:DUF5915 domain-containing protein, partial [Gilvibacter sp.]|uniref:DUF5915 domain-containing protein n=1 Tax=Gilvibacter sp. TaxID=2729997 RepID=UPI0025BFA89E
NFVQENLSNWYVRLCRRRFWKGAYGPDKISAYQTLYTCLHLVAQLSAPIAPFYMDRLYQDLNAVCSLESASSVHLSDFPKADEALIDSALEHRMQKAQTISSLVLSLRKKEQIKVRQPLQRIMIPVLDAADKAEIELIADLVKSEVNVKEIELLDDASGILVKQIKPNFKVLGPKFGKDMKAVAAAVSQFTQEDIQTIEKEGEMAVVINEKNIILGLPDVEISSQDIEGWLVANNGPLTVALDVSITPELKSEGIARELVNRIQNVRKDSGFEVTDQVSVTIQKAPELEAAVAANLEYIKTETLTASLEFTDDLKEGTEVAFDDIETRLAIKKY